MKPQKLSIDVLKEDPRNARKIDDGALQGLAVSIETFGDLSSIVYNTRTGHLVAGHQRMKTLRSAGAKTWTRVSDAEGEIVHPKSKEKFRIRIVDWDETTERLANISANNTEIQGEFVDEDLALQLRELETEAQFEALRLNDLMATVVEDEASSDSAEDAASGGLQDAFQIIVECSNEAQQRDLLERWAAEGLNVRALTR